MGRMKEKALRAIDQTIADIEAEKRTPRTLPVETYKRREPELFDVVQAARNGWSHTKPAQKAPTWWDEIKASNGQSVSKPMLTYPRLYFAYGSNLSIAQMSVRCPNADAYSIAELPGYKLAFRGPADVIPAKEATTVAYGALYWITPRDEQALDRYEGWPTVYRKVYRRGRLPNGQSELAMMYIMNPERVFRPPSDSYVSTIAEGYRDWGLPLRYLERRAKAYGWQPIHYPDGDSK